MTEFGRGLQGSGRAFLTPRKPARREPRPPDSPAGMGICKHPLRKEKRRNRCKFVVRSPGAKAAPSFTPAKLVERTLQRRAVEAVIWGMPLVNTDPMRRLQSEK